MIHHAHQRDFFIILLYEYEYDIKKKKFPLGTD